MNNRAIVEELYRAFRERDFDAFRAICAEDLEWIQCAGFPGGGVHRGADAVLANVFEKNRQTWEGFAFHRDELLDADDAIVVLGKYKGVHHETSKTMEAAAVHVYDVVEGKISRFRMYADTQPMWASMTP